LLASGDAHCRVQGAIATGAEPMKHLVPATAKFKANLTRRTLNEANLFCRIIRPDLFSSTRLALRSFAAGLVNSAPTVTGRFLSRI
jgi:hypothetical protein